MDEFVKNVLARASGAAETAASVLRSAAEREATGARPPGRERRNHRGARGTGWAGWDAEACADAMRERDRARVDLAAAA